MAGENAHAEYPLCISERAAFEKNLVGVDRELRAFLYHKVALKAIEEFIGLLTLDFCTL